MGKTSELTAIHSPSFTLRAAVFANDQGCDNVWSKNKLQFVYLTYLATLFLYPSALGILLAHALRLHSKPLVPMASMYVQPPNSKVSS